MKKSIYATIFLLSLAGLALENALTRIFSITMWYHYAFMAISVAMLGMSTGAVKVYVSDMWSLSKGEIEKLICRYSRFFALFTVISLFVLLAVPFVPRATGIGIFTTWFIYVTAAVPFYFAGVVVALIITTKFIENVSKLYAFDLAGAAAGTLFFFLMLSITDAVTFIILLAGTGFLASFFISKKKTDLILFIFILCFGAFNHLGKTFKIEWVKVNEGVLSATVEENIEWEKWTPFSRLTVTDVHDNFGFGWGISGRMMAHYPNYKVEQKELKIDSAAATIITKRGLPIEGLLHLKYDITNMVHYLFPDSRVGIIGVGGGRDVLSALHFGQKEVWGIEINGKILDAATKHYSHYTYDFSKLPNVHLVEDEARSFFERSDLEFDIIQASLIDSWAATTSGAFVLTENSLYTVEAWDTFLSKLSDNGAITMSRWYFPKRPGELLRLVNLAYEALLRAGIKEPHKHILLAGVNFFENSSFPIEDHYGSGTAIISKKPFKQNIIDRFVSICDTYGFEKLLTAGNVEEKNIFNELISSLEKRDSFVASYPLDISPPTDDNPFFFNMLKPSHAFKNEKIEHEGPLSTNLLAVKNLLSLVAIVVILAIFLIVVPLIAKMKIKTTTALFNRHSGYFISIGAGFMLIEVALIQKFAIFLGHPAYSILVVLFTVLFFSGVGSLYSKKLFEKVGIKWLFVIIVSVVAAIGSTNMFILPYLSSWAMVPRIIYSFAVMAATGFVLGIPFPTGLSLLSGTEKEKAPWYWGVNGAAGVVSSVVAISISIFYGISATFFIGLFCYLMASIFGFFSEKAFVKG
ncbi:MAG: hypothetical protein ACOX2F_01065 [bacterium]